MAINIDTKGFESMHGHKPRGRRTCWVFEIAGKNIYSPDGKTYSEVCVWARAKAKDMGTEEIRVLG